MWLQALLLVLLAMEASTQETGFISIDCGLDRNSSYTDESSGIVYSPDGAFIDTGVNGRVSANTNLTGLFGYYSTLRSFPTGARNCYTLGPVRRGGRYLVKAEFEYGNYDGTKIPPTFDVYLGVNKWGTVPPDDFSWLEIIAIAPSESLQVCLVNTGLGTPFISSLELRPLLDTMYTMANETHSLVLQEERKDYGIDNPSMSYPDDPFDRAWFSSSEESGWNPVTTERNVSVEAGDLAAAPPAVFMTAVTTQSRDQGMDFSVEGSPGEKILVFLYFAEIQEIGANQTREFAVFLNDSRISGPYVPEFLTGLTVQILHELGGGGTSNYSVKVTANSTLPPILNGREVYKLVELKSLPTDEGDVAAMTEIKRLYEVKKNWNGDPCMPQNISWEGLNCSYSDIQNPRITALNLSQSGINGIIAPSIANLTALVSLDLSGNNLTGEIPTALAELLQLKVLNLENNQLSGMVPKILHERSQNQTLRLSTDGNTKLCNKMDSCEIINGKAKHIVPIVVGISVAAIVLYGIFILVWRLKGRKRGTVRRELQERRIENSRDNIGLQVKRQQQDLNLGSHQFSFSEIINITRNFEQIIGRGSFGIVYHGLLNDGREAAVKMLTKSSQGAKEFHAEAQILSRVHHKNLVYLLGYCDDKNNLALVYEYMPKGSLADHLSGDRDDAIGLNWNMRLKIALDVAQGLDYLHSFCKPSIVHRDVKTRNILLSAELEAKLGDFGLSKLFGHDDATHISTVVAGTPGYLDPEYYQTYRLSEKSDVYSFGVVLLEIITGQPPISHDNAPIVPWVRSRLERGDISSIADQRFNGDYDLTSIWKTVEVAMACASPTSSRRPKMSDVVVQLKECLKSLASRDISGSFSIQRPNLNDIGAIAFSPSTSPSAR